MDEQSGGTELLEQLFQQNHERMKKLIAFRLAPSLRRRIDESDVLQDAFVEACRKFENYKKDPKVPAFLWLRLIVTETLIDLHRHHLGVQSRDPRREAYEHLGSFGQTTALLLADHLIGDFTPPHIAVSRQETLQRLRNVLEELEPIDREILALRHGEQLTRHEVAGVLNIPTATAAKRYVRALARLRKRMEDSHEEYR